MGNDCADTLLAEARALTEARLARRGALLRERPGGSDGEALAYALEASGKGVRAALVLACYDACQGGQAVRRSGGQNGQAVGRSGGQNGHAVGRSGGQDGQAVRRSGGQAVETGRGRPAGIAAAVEIVHTYSLVHDDLPCMDDDAQRRGRPTLHVRFGVATATRAGFLLVPVAILELAAAAGELGLPADILARMAELLLEASGIRGMVAGQWLDLAAEGHNPALPELIEIHRRKTGALIEAACVLGALAGGAAPGVLAALQGYGREIGLAFQIADDLLDATATTEQLGKTAGRDSALAKATYVSVLGLEPARREAYRHAELACDALRHGRVASATLDALADYIVMRRS